jgi:hypothetical protein
MMAIHAPMRQTCQPKRSESSNNSPAAETIPMSSMTTDTPSSVRTRSKARFGVLALISVGTWFPQQERPTGSANLAGIVTPLVIGAIALLGALSYVVLLGDIHRIEFEPEGAIP